MSFEKLPKVCDVRFCANVFRKSVTRRRTSVRKGALAELGAGDESMWRSSASAPRMQNSLPAAGTLLILLTVSIYFF